MTPSRRHALKRGQHTLPVAIGRRDQIHRRPGERGGEHEHIDGLRQQTSSKAEPKSSVRAANDSDASASAPRQERTRLPMTALIIVS
jgi:hypothetical protein